MPHLLHLPFPAYQTLCLLDSTLQLTFCSVWRCLGISEETLHWLQQAISLQPFVFSERGNPTVQAQQNEWSWVQSKWHWSQQRQQFLLDFCKHWIGPPQSRKYVASSPYQLVIQGSFSLRNTGGQKTPLYIQCEVDFLFSLGVHSAYEQNIRAFIRASLNPADLLV